MAIGNLGGRGEDAVAEFLCDTLRSNVYDRRAPVPSPAGREWVDLPRSFHRHEQWEYSIPRPANDDLMSAREQRRVDYIGIPHLLGMISITSTRNLDLSDQELRGLLHCYEYLRYEREPWWSEGRDRNVI